MKNLVKQDGREQEFLIESAATSPEDVGQPIFPPVCRLLRGHGLPCEGKVARLLENHDYENYDMLIGMDQKNLRDMYLICGGDYANKIHLLLDFTETPGNIADPWYTENYVQTWMQVQLGCKGLLESLKKT